MAINKEYSFFEENFAVFSWYGCTIESVGKCQIYDSDSTPMISYVNTHAQLEAIRDIALANGDRGPRVIVVGPKDHGKSTTCKILASYAARLDRTPIFVDLDVGQGSLSIPGCICAVPLEKSSLSIEVIRSKFFQMVIILEVLSVAVLLLWVFFKISSSVELLIYFKFVDHQLPSNVHDILMLI